jgi:hypothetical protein
MKAKRVSGSNYDYEYENDQFGRGMMSPVHNNEFQRASRQPSRKSFNPNFENDPLNGGYVSIKSFFKTGKGKALIGILATTGLLIVAGGIAGLIYYLVVTSMETSTFKRKNQFEKRSFLF